jgi:hypothetical protein
MATLPANIRSLSAAEKFELLDALLEDLKSTHPRSVQSNPKN